MRAKHFLLLLFTLPSLAVAQYDSRLGRFRVNEIKGCAPFTVTITDANLITVGQCTGGPAPLPNNPCDMTWSDGTVNQNTFTHTYTQPGTYLLRVLYQSMNPREDDITITVTPNTLPNFDIYTCSGLEVQVKVTDTNYDSYFINYGDGSPHVAVPVGMLATDDHTYLSAGMVPIEVRGKNLNAADNCTPATKTVNVVNSLAAPFVNLLTVTSGTQIDLNFTSSNNVLYRVEGARNTEAPASFQLVQTIHDVSTVAITNSTIRTDDNYYCTRLGAYDPCNNTSIYSNIICSANFDLALQSNVNNLTWASATTGVSNFDVTRDGASIGTTGALTFADNTVVCKTNYCYQLLTNYANGSQSISLEKCGEAFSTDIPTAINNITAVVGDGGGVDLTWQQDPAFQPAEYSVFRKSGSGGFSLLSTTVPTQFTDADYSTDGAYCYQVNYLDVCGNASETGIEACPIRLTESITSDNSISLNWTAYTGWTNGVLEYIVEKYDGEGVPLQTFNVGTATTFEDSSSDPDNQLYVYVVIAVPNNAGLGQSISNDVTAIKEPNLFYPKAFTPNGDNLNDIFMVFGQYIVDFELNIFNRWGQLLFSTNDLNQGWDGKYKGNVQPEGTYAFVANLTDLSGRTFKRSGSVVLLRKKQ